jgi:hypothetical protein
MYPSPTNASAARIHVPEALPSHRERDGGYPTVARLSDTVRVIECKDGLQWILQRRSGDQWKGLAYCRTRAALLREASGLLGHVPEVLLQLPEHHDGFIEEVPRCGICGRIATKPIGALPRHMFCIAVRKPAVTSGSVPSLQCGLRAAQGWTPSLTSQRSTGEPFGTGYL